MSSWLPYKERRRRRKPTVLCIIQIAKSQHFEVDTHQCQRKREEGKERDRGTEGETSYPNQGKWRAHRGQKKKKQKENLKKKNGARSPNPATLDPSVASYDPQGSHGDPILSTTLLYVRYLHRSGVSIMGSQPSSV